MDECAIAPQIAQSRSGNADGVQSDASAFDQIALAFRQKTDPGPAFDWVRYEKLITE